MQTIRQIASLRTEIAQWRAAGARVALVPTMGALHQGHIALVEAARRHADKVVASIFVNPRQFGANEDLSRYPRRELQDARMLADAGCAALWLPAVDEMYPAGFATTITVGGVSEGLDGAARPGHFDGVATVVTKLFNQVQPDIALFGEKDWQQLAIIRRMARDLDLTHPHATRILGVPTVREADGLAMSSRNKYLTPEERAAAPAMNRAMREAAARIAAGEPVAAALAALQSAILAAGFARVDYAELRDAATLEALDPWDGRPARLLVAAHMGKARLIDNIAVTG